MSSDTESWLRKLENESDALKIGFERAATTIPMITKTINHTTTRNQITVVDPGGSTQQDDPERVVVTFDTLSGSNTLAKLELTTDANGLPIVRRAPYSGGARWIVTGPTKNPFGTWEPTHYTFVVQSMVDGTLSTSELTT